MNFLSEEQSAKNHSLEKKIDKLIVEGHCSDVSPSSLANTPKIGDEPYKEKIQEQIQKWNDSKISKSDQKTFLKNALICRVKHQNEKIREIAHKMQGLKSSSSTPSKSLEHELERNVLHKAFVIEYISKHKLLENTSPPKSKSVFGTMKRVFSSKNVGGKTRKYRCNNPRSDYNQKIIEINKRIRESNRKVRESNRKVRESNRKTQRK
jgi:hypothetical protein